MYRAYEACVVRTNQMTHFNGIIQVLNLETDKAFLPMAAFAQKSPAASRSM